jgi:hypothetical protein
LTQTKIPPVSGHPVASSAETSATGMKKRMEETIKKNREENPYSAVSVQFLMLQMAATLIIASMNAFNTRLFSIKVNLFCLV